jgi:hypothetical protein
MEESTRARRRKRETAKMDLQPSPGVFRRTGRPPRGGVGRVCGAPPGRTQGERSPRGTGRPKRGKGRVCTMETTALWFLPSVPRCVRATRWGREARDPGRPGRVRRRGRGEMLRHPQTKGRATANANITLKPAGGRGGDKRKRSSSRGAARSRSGVWYSGTSSEHKAAERCRVQRRCSAQKAGQRGKAPCSTKRTPKAGDSEEVLEGWIVPFAKDPPPAGRTRGNDRT